TRCMGVRATWRSHFPSRSTTRRSEEEPIAPAPAAAPLPPGGRTAPAARARGTNSEFSFTYGGRAIRRGSPTGAGAKAVAIRAADARTPAPRALKNPDPRLDGRVRNCAACPTAHAPHVKTRGIVIAM